MSDNEENLQEEIGEMNINSLLKAQIKLNATEKFTSKKQKEIEKRKSKNAPKEFSAKVKPKKRKLPVNFEVKNNLRRDPRFENYTGDFQQKSFEKNYGFVENYSKDFVEKINKLKKKRKFNIEPEKFELIKKHENLVKGWIKKKEHDKLKENIQTDIDQENRERIKLGKKKIFLKKNVLKEVINKKVLEKKGESARQLKKYMKKKNHNQAARNKKEEKFSKSLNKD